eukprot:gene1220-biopygen449
MEFLNAQTPGGMPLHSLQLKFGTTIILLRNIEPAKGLCNGTRLIVRDLKQHIITAEIITTQNKGQYVILPRITMTCQDSSLPISMARKQFQVRLAYCLTNNKAQGQSLTHVGIYLPEPVFAHGQLYVAISRAQSFSGLKLRPTPDVFIQLRQKTWCLHTVQAKDLVSSYSSDKHLMSSYSSGKRPGVFIQLRQKSDVFIQLRQKTWCLHTAQAKDLVSSYSSGKDLMSSHSSGKDLMSLFSSGKDLMSSYNSGKDLMY